jgi:hypothetical protein
MEIISRRVSLEFFEFGVLCIQRERTIKNS